MHDLNTINRLNAETFAGKINAERRLGRYVVGYYDGAHMLDYAVFNTAERAASEANAEGLPYSERRVVYGPITGPARDQSEDRRQPYTLEQLAALGRRSVGDPAPAFV